MREAWPVLLTIALAGCPGERGSSWDTGSSSGKQDRQVSPVDISGPLDTGAAESGKPKQDQGPPQKDTGVPPKDLHKCPPVPSCNWCNGAGVKDTKGCLVGFKCANGVDPCKTQPCTATSCAAGKYCGKDKLCWGYMDSGVTPPKDTGPTIWCFNWKCSGSSGGSCTCDWSCSNAVTYKAVCTAGGGKYSCKCYRGGALTGSCSYTSSKICPQNEMAKCCGYPYT